MQYRGIRREPDELPHLARTQPSTSSMICASCAPRSRAAFRRPAGGIAADDVNAGRSADLVPRRADCPGGVRGAFSAQPLNHPGVSQRHNLEEFLAQPAMACLNLRKVSSEEIE